MILPDFMIRDLRVGPLMDRHVVEPFTEKALANGLSYGLSCAGYDIRTRERALVAPGGFVLLSSLEHFVMPDDLIARVCDKSTWARQGVCVQTTVIECGWRGYLTLEVTNHGAETAEIRAGDPIAQIVFEQMAAPAERPYRGKYNDQPARPVAAILEGGSSQDAA